VFCNPGLDGFNVGDANDGTVRAQGRVMVDGQVINSGTNLALGGQTGGYTADIANAQEVNIQLSGALGESETGGASINIVPRTGGNRYAGEFNTTYTRKAFFDRNTASVGLADVLQPIVSDHGRLGRLWRPDQARSTVVLLRRPRPGYPQGAWPVRQLLAEPLGRQVGL
jgi:hypothetical protein